MRSLSCAAAFAAAAVVAAPAAAFVIDFEGLAPGTALASQFAAQGVVFSANAISGSGWATNTDLTLVSIDTGALGEDYSALGSPSLVSGNIVRSFRGWLEEDGDPSFAIELATPARRVGVSFAGVAGRGAAPAVALRAYAGTTLLAEQRGSLPDDEVGQLAIEVSGLGITRVVVTPGGVDDWVAFDLVSVTPVGEPATALLWAGAGAAAWALRRRRGGDGRRS